MKQAGPMGLARVRWNNRAAAILGVDPIFETAS
jgi:hypothetical protein